jgi:hypothetical protein
MSSIHRGCALSLLFAIVSFGRPLSWFVDIPGKAIR